MSKSNDCSFINEHAHVRFLNTTLVGRRLFKFYCNTKRVAERMLASKPSVAAVGSLDNLPSMDIIEAGLLDRNRPTTAPTRKMFGFRTD